MRRAQNEEIAAFDHLVEGKQFGVGGHERIGGEHRLGQTRERFLELVAQRGAGVVDVGLERHTEQPDRHPREIIAPAKVFADVQHQALVDQHGGVAEAELVLGEGGELHRVLHQARARREARGRNAAGARIVSPHRIVDPAVIETRRLRDQVELVRGRELDVAVGVAEELCEFRLARLHDDQLGGDGGKQLCRRLLGRRRRAADDLRCFLQLAYAVPLHHALRAEGDLEVAGLAPEIAIEPIGRAGKYRRAQHQELAVGEIRQQPIDALLHHLPHRIEELIDGRADGDDDGARWDDIRRRRCKNEPVALERSPQQFLAAVFDELQTAGPQRLEGFPIDVVDVDAIARLGEGKHERNADVTGAADDGQIGGIEARRHCRGGLGAGNIHAKAPNAGARSCCARVASDSSAFGIIQRPRAVSAIIKARAEPATASGACRDSPARAAWARARRRCARKR